jgi:hypothetical protein
VVRKPKIQKVKEKKKKIIRKVENNPFCNLQSRARIGDRLV